MSDFDAVLPPADRFALELAVISNLCEEHIAKWGSQSLVDVNSVIDLLLDIRNTANG